MHTFNFILIAAGPPPPIVQPHPLPLLWLGSVSVLAPINQFQDVRQDLLQGPQRHKQPAPLRLSQYFDLWPSSVREKNSPFCKHMYLHIPKTLTQGCEVSGKLTRLPCHIASSIDLHTLCSKRACCPPVSRKIYMYHFITATQNDF